MKGDANMNIEELEIEVNELYHAGYISDEEFEEIVSCLDEDEDELVLRQIASVITQFRARIYRW